MKRIDDVLGYSDLKIFQDSQFFSFSLDSIILANYSHIRLRDRNIVDLCSGNCVVPLILSKRCDCSIDAVEIQNKLCLLANQSISINNLNNRINLFCMDIKDFSNDSSHLNSYDLVLCNPPYFKNNENSTKNISYEKMIARHEILITLDDVCKSASRILKDNGNFCMVHRCDRLMDVITSFRKYNLEPKRIKFVYENLNKECFLFLIEGQKCGNVGLKIDKPLIMYHEDGSMTEEYKRLQNEVIL